MAALVTIAKVKSEPYLNITATTHDLVLSNLIDDVSDAVIDYLDLDTDYTIATVPDRISDAICTEIAYRWRVRQTPGQISHTYQDGSVTKENLDEFIPSVKQILDRQRIKEISI